MLTCQKEHIYIISCPLDKTDMGLALDLRLNPNWRLTELTQSNGVTKSRYTHAQRVKTLFNRRWVCSPSYSRRSSVGVGYRSPLKTWPKWPPQRAQVISVLTMPKALCVISDQNKTLAVNHKRSGVKDARREAGLTSSCRLTAPGNASKKAVIRETFNLNFWPLFWRSERA